MALKKILIVMNPISGGLEKAGIREEIETYCKEQRIESHYFETSGHQDKANLAEMVKRQQPDAVFAAGGDGTVHLVAAALQHHKHIPIGIFPLGSGNGLSKDLGIPQDITKALQILEDPRPQSIDTLLVNGRLCIHVMDLGFNALVVKRFDEAATRGPGTYVKIALQEYLSFQPKHFLIETDNGTFEGPAFMITVTNANNFGSNATVNPHGILNDGIFEVCIIEPFPKPAGVGILYQLYNETIHQSVYTKIIRCTRATITNTEMELMQIDGEIVPTADKITVQVQPKSLTFLLQEKPHNVLQD